MLGLGNFKLNKELNGIEGRMLKASGGKGGGGGATEDSGQEGDYPA